MQQLLQAREWAEALLARRETTMLHPHHFLVMRIKMRLMRASASSPMQLKRKVDGGQIFTQKSRIRETLNLLTDADRSNNTN